MAWEEFDRDGVELMSGDAPLDAFSQALERIALAYQQRFRRKPTVGELLLSLERVLRAMPERYVADPHGMQTATLFASRGPGEQRRVDSSRYQGGYGELPSPHYFVETRESPDTAREVVCIPNLEVAGRTLNVDYEIVGDDLTDDDVMSLVPEVVLKEYSDDYYRSKADEIAFRNLQTGFKRAIPYPK
jgi:hypothetical protein